MNVWDWVHEFEYEAHRNGDMERVRLAQIHHEAYSYRHTQPEQMLCLLEEGRRTAKALDEPWWVLFFDHWCLETCIYYKDDYRQIIDLGVRATLELRKPQYEHHPLRFCIHCNLIAAYLCVDPVGYADEIRSALEYLDSEVGPEGESKYLLIARQHWFAFELQDYAEAKRHCDRWLAFTQVDDDWHLALHHGVGVHMGLAHVSHRLGDYDAMAEYAVRGEELARQRSSQFELACFLAWQALALLYQNHPIDADRRYRLATRAMDRLGKQPDDSFYEAVCTFHEKQGQLDEAWRLREKQFDDIVDKGQLSTEVECRLHRLRLLRLMKSPMETEQRLLEEAMSRLRRPEWYRQRYDRVLAGGGVW